MELYVNSIGIISGTGNNISGGFLMGVPDYETTCLHCLEPDYTGMIPPMQLRRMSKSVRMGVAASRRALQKAQIEKPDAISVGTAYGCLQDTEVFLSKMTEQDEQMLTPTAFIQSTHNTVSGQIALLNKCNGHNLTFVQKGHSFEQAMLNAQLYLSEHPDENVLVGGIDELTEGSIAALQLAGVYTKENKRPGAVLSPGPGGAVGGEGAAFFVVTTKPIAEKVMKIKKLDMFKTSDMEEAFEWVKNFTKDRFCMAALGLNGDDTYAAFYQRLRKELYNENAQAVFKHMCGEYSTAGAYALGMMYEIMDKGVVPEFVDISRPVSELKDVLIVNNFKEYFSCWLVELSV